MQPYIGITDFSRLLEVRVMRDILEAHDNRGGHVLHVGVMISYKTLYGIRSRWAKVWPNPMVLPLIFHNSRVYNCLHYADYDDHPGLFEHLQRALSFAGPDVHALQLDMIWPDPDELAKLHEVRGNKPVEIVLQIGANAIAAEDNDPVQVVNRLSLYKDVVHRVLLDKSMGRGLGMDAEGLLPFAREIKNRFPEIGLGAAGGLGPNSIHLVEPLVAEFPDLSIDAQGQLRPSGNAMDPIDWIMAAGYLMSALRLFNKYN